MKDLKQGKLYKTKDGLIVRPAPLVGEDGGVCVEVVDNRKSKEAKMKTKGGDLCFPSLQIGGRFSMSADGLEEI